VNAGLGLTYGLRVTQNVKMSLVSIEVAMVPHNVVIYRCNKEGRWLLDETGVDGDSGRILSNLTDTGFAPLSLNSSHGAHDCSERSIVIDEHKLMLYPRSATPSTGLIGTLHNNQVADMVPWENDHVPTCILADREYRDTYTGFICAGHTSHSTEAGRMRRVTCDTKVRIMSDQTPSDIRDMKERCERHGSGGEWRLFCLGKWTYISDLALASVVSFHRIARLAGSYRACTCPPDTNSALYQFHQAQ
jgi:hypothetical protein